MAGISTKAYRCKNYMGFEVYSTSGYHYIAVNNDIQFESYDIGILHTKIYDHVKSVKEAA